MTRRIVHRWSGSVLWEGEADTIKDALHAAIAARADLTDADLTRADLTRADLTRAVLTGAVLTGADLTRAVLTGAVLTRAVLTGADLTRADLTGADLTRADLTDADLTGADLTRADLTRADLTDADLTRADLTGADLTRADLTGADLTDADLTRADLTPIRDDLWAVLSGAPAEVPALLEKLKAGQIDGSVYEGACACLVGTIANARGCDKDDLGPALQPNADRPIERFFLVIRPGDTPETNPFSKLATEWTEDWLSRMRATFAEGRGEQAE